MEYFFLKTAPAHSMPLSMVEANPHVVTSWPQKNNPVEIWNNTCPGY